LFHDHAPYKDLEILSHKKRFVNFDLRLLTCGFASRLFYPAVANVPVAEPVYWPGA
jgi:hypothetical protein